MKNWFMALALAAVTLVPGLCLIYYTNQKLAATQEVPSPPEPQYIAQFQFEQPPVIKNLEAGTTFEVKACRIIDGHRYEMSLEGGKYIEAHLSVISKEEAALFVVEVLQKIPAKPPTVTLMRRMDDHWIVDFELTFEGQRVKMSQLLKAKGMIL